MLTEKITLKTEAVFSDDREYRFLLRKEWAKDKPKVAIIMVNPSISDLVTTDLTTTFITNNLVKLDFGGFDILNLIPKVSGKIKLCDVENIQAEMFDENIKQISKSIEVVDRVAIAWGSLNLKDVNSIKNEVFEILRKHEEKVYAISNELDGKLYHPLAPQIRSEWIFVKFDLKKVSKKDEDNRQE